MSGQGWRRRALFGGSAGRRRPSVHAPRALRRARHVSRRAVHAVRGALRRCAAAHAIGRALASPRAASPFPPPSPSHLVRHEQRFQHRVVLILHRRRQPLVRARAAHGEDAKQSEAHPHRGRGGDRVPGDGRRARAATAKGGGWRHDVFFCETRGVAGAGFAQINALFHALQRPLSHVTRTQIRKRAG